jgi:elongation of very long chain fatty acids protein 4
MTTFKPWRELPPDVDLFDLNSLLRWADRVSDPRVADWPLMYSVKPTVAICVLYLLFVFIGSAVMKRRKEPFSLKGVMIGYNIVVIGLNACLLVGFAQEIVKRKYKIVCNAVDYSEDGVPMAKLVYFYYLSKAFDFSDTAFIILRKKFDQLSFLHVYHHATMFFIWYMAVKWAAGGDGIAGPVFNSFIHMIMYMYYLGATLQIKIPGKKYLTQMQIAQFFVVIGHSSASIFLDCPYPHWTLYAQIVFLLTLFVLFLNFYVNSYRAGKRLERDAKKSQ